MGRQKRRGGEDAERVQARFSALLNRVVALHARDGRIDRVDVDAEMSHRLRRDQTSKLRRYLAGTERPRTATAWHLGETLHECGATWIGGPALLYAGGLLVDFASTVLNVLEPSGEIASVEDVVVVRSLVNSVDDLMISTELDCEPELISTHVRVRSMGEVQQDVRTSVQRLHIAPDDQLSLASIITQREHAKMVWTQYAALRLRFQTAFENHVESRIRLSEEGMVVQSLASSKIEFSVRSTAVREALARWCDVLAEPEEESDAW